MSRTPARSSRQQKPDYILLTLVAVAIVLLIAVVCVYVINFVLPDGNANPSDPSQDTDIPETTLGDTVAPELSGVHDFVLYQGDAISYYKGITATDDKDPNPTITVDNSAVDLSKAGVYEVIYICTDKSGNEIRIPATVTVLEKKDGYAQLEDIYAAVDNKLAQIITENMDTRQQVVAIYNWARSHLSYFGDFDSEDYRQAAYIMLTQSKGDCYGFFAVTKLMFERLNIPNIDVRKVKDSTTRNSDHYWSLVSVDGGNTWYHFDSTPFSGPGDDFCLVTDAFLDAYSASHKNSHNRDKSLYPATP